MNRAQKEAFVNELGEGVKASQAMALLSFNKLTAEQMSSFRLGLRKKNVRVKVVKNTLAKRVFDGSPFKELSATLTGPVLLAYSSEDPISAAKAITEWLGKENFDLKLKMGVALGKVMTDVEIKTLAKLPGRNEMLVSFLWALKSTPTKFLYALTDTPNKAGYALAALREKKQKEAGGAV